MPPFSPCFLLFAWYSKHPLDQESAGRIPSVAYRKANKTDVSFPKPMTLLKT